MSSYDPLKELLRNFKEEKENESIPTQNWDRLRIELVRVEFENREGFDGFLMKVFPIFGTLAMISLVYVYKLHGQVDESLYLAMSQYGDLVSLVFQGA